MTTNFRSDNETPVAAAIMEAIVEANHGTAWGYAEDDWSEKLDQAFSDLFRTDAIVLRAGKLQKRTSPGSEKWYFYEGVKKVSEALARFGERYADLASDMAQNEPDPLRKKELNEIGELCRNVPRHPARSFREAVQSLFFAQVVINLESLDNIAVY